MEILTGRCDREMWGYRARFGSRMKNSGFGPAALKTPSVVRADAVFSGRRVQILLSCPLASASHALVAGSR